MNIDHLCEFDTFLERMKENTQPSYSETMLERSDDYPKGGLFLKPVKRWGVSFYIDFDDRNNEFAVKVF